jgi:hypothetical protein
MKIPAARIFFCFLTVCFISLSAIADEREIYTYRDPIFPKKRLSINVSERFFQIAGVAIPMSICGNDEDYICVVSDGFYFHIPKSGELSNREWNVQGIRYTSENKEEVSIWGKLHSVSRISGVSKKMHIIYLYSKDSGLVGFSFVDKKSGAKGTYLLDGLCGFGAQGGQVC